MKILNIHFKNINSLEGESRIHFDQAPIADSGVFAITGPNGSGKSSILDAITLGLYGETYRFDRPADHVMTRTTAESFARVEFLLGDEVFRSSWSVKREHDNPSGTLLPAEMTLTRLNGEEQFIEQNPANVRNKMLQLTGMDFHKFSKSMVLAQGDFAAFLNALDNERMDILEKVSGTDIYDDYQKQALEKHNQATTLLQQLQQDLSAIPIMDVETLAAKKADLADFQQQLADLEHDHDEVQQQLSQRQKIAELDALVNALTEKLEQLQAQQQEKQLALDKIATAPDLSDVEEQITALDTKQQEVQNNQQALQAFRRELEDLQRQSETAVAVDSEVLSGKTISQQKNSIEHLKQTLDGLELDLPKQNAALQTLQQQIDEKKTALKAVESWLQENATEKQLLQHLPRMGKLKELRAELAKLQVQQKAKIKESKAAEKAHAKKKTAIEQLKNKIQSVNATIEANEKAIASVTEVESLEELQAILSDQQERVENLQELSDLAVVNAKLGKKGLFGLAFLKKTANQEVGELEQEADRLQLQIGKENLLIQTLEQAVINEKLLQQMLPLRVHLVDGKPCPLCGALDHPYAQHAPAVSNSTDILEEQKRKVKLLNSELQSLERKVKAAKLQAERDEVRDEKLAVIQTQWKSLANRLNIAHADLEIENPSLMKDLLKSAKKELSNIKKLIKNYSKQQDAIAAANTELEVHQASLMRMMAEVEVVEQAAEAAPDVADDKALEALSESINKQQAEEQALVETLSKQLEQLGTKMPTKGKEDDFFKLLNNKRQVYQDKELQQKTLNKDIQQLQKQRTEVYPIVEQIERDIVKYSGQLKQEEGLGFHLALLEKQKLIAEKEAQITQQEVDLQSLQQHVLAKTQEAGVSDIEQLKETISLVKNQNQINQAQIKLIDEIDKTEKQLHQVQSELEAEQATTTQAQAQTEDTLLSQQKSLQERLDIARQEVESIKHKLDRQQDLQDKFDDFSARIESQIKLVAETEANVQLTKSNRTAFRKKVQQAMADKLLSQANQVLEKISGRYYVRRVLSEHGLALEIEDTRQQNVRRLPKTLSGGESFVVSLALALGLAEMAKNKYALDSLFLDEGFGNLDAESLYAVMTTLENLKTQGKVVGIISHVDGVHKRIKTQIEMIKKPNGMSALKGVS